MLDDMASEDDDDDVTEVRKRVDAAINPALTNVIIIIRLLPQKRRRTFLSFYHKGINSKIIQDK